MTLFWIIIMRSHKSQIDSYIFMFKVQYNINKMQEVGIYERKMPRRYQSTKNEFKTVDRYIQGITHEDMSQLITGIPFIYEIYKKNNHTDQWNLLNQLMRAPSESDGPGFVYGFMNQKQNNLLQAPYWIKMGRTSQNPPQKRIFQWEKEEGEELTEIFTVRSLYNMKLQALVHKLFAFARQKRVLNGKLRKQWFKFDEITLTAAAVNILNHLMNTIHTSHSLCNPKVFMNRNLKQLTDKLIQSSNQIKDIISNQASPQLISSSIARDLGIEIGRNDQLKLKLEQSTQIIQILSLIDQFSLGKHLQLCFASIQNIRVTINQCLSKLEQFQAHLVKDIRQIYSKTKINHYSNQNPITVPYHIPKQSNKCAILIQNNKNQQKSTQKKAKLNNLSQENKKSTQKKKQRKYTNKSNSQHKIQAGNKQQAKYSQNQQQSIKNIELETSVIQVHAQEAIFQKQINANEQKIWENETVQQKQNLNMQRIQNRIQKQQERRKVEQVDLQIKQNETNFKNQQLPTTVYNERGKSRKQITCIPSQQIKLNNLAIAKYRRKDQKNQYSHQRPSKQKAKQAINEFVNKDLNQTMTEQQIQKQIAIIQSKNSKVNELFFQIERVSQLLNYMTRNASDAPYLIYANQFFMDVSIFELNFNFVIMAKQIIVSQPIQISRGKDKGILRIFCSDLKKEMKDLKIDKSCAKYVGLFKVQSMQSIVALDSYHKRKDKIDEVIKSLSEKFINIFSQK